MTSVGRNLPILVIVNSRGGSPLSLYIAEVLAAEGIACGDILDLAAATLTDAHLAGRDIVLLAHAAPDRAAQALLTEYVASGGNLIALRPPLEMLKTFGLKPAPGIVRLFAEGYVTLDASQPLASNLHTECLQFHGDADLYEPHTATALGFIAGKPWVRTHYPAVTINEHGRGRAAAFAFDLAASTVLFHQGTPLNSSIGPNPDPDRDLAYKPCDLFFRFLDERFKTIPQADVHQDLLVRIVEWMSERRRPLPRLWHFPNAAPAVALIDGDSDSMPTADFEKVIEIVERVGAKYTLYLMTNDFKAVSPDRFRELQRRGHDFGPHIFAGRMPGVEEMRLGIRKEALGFRERYAYSPVAHRGHSVIWVGWTEHAKFLHENGIRLDGNVYPGAGYQHGYCNASGLPVKFMDETGALVDVYEQATLSSEDMLLTDKALLPVMTVDEAIKLSLTQIDEAADKYHGVYHPCFHPVYVHDKQKCSAPWIEAVTRHCRDRGLLFVNGREWAEFNDARRAVRIEDLSWDSRAGHLSFRLRAPKAVAGLTILLPARFQGRAARNQKSVSLESRDQIALVLNLRADDDVPVSVEYE